ncbi:N-terminal acetyltransferase A, auxiliary subunit [Linderina pennispora]|uniref:N-terminal acetyltransferase A, auxiliary subunit n=1 Tax=Linderina pennispora TaxID=61395 RepID=A0A1Y1WFG2_9FUNG|nr:N-terminal acetyltransferase A, auxiliary subunit [Linderina pennispora]ORX72058.1 N-terminal acetyltransferase A, auxiliary subunit [Linderina pennispora]
MPLQISQLPHKEQTLFRSALKLFEVRQYKKGLKTVEQILKKFPQHGESHAVKGLFLANLDRKDEGYASLRKGLEIDPNSSLCWQISGLVHRLDANYVESSKSFANALKTDSENIQILRDLAQMQVQLRQFDQLVETRLKLVKVNPGDPMFWLGLAVAHQMNKRKWKLNVAAMLSKSEFSELLLYKNWLMELNGDYNDALDNLKEIHSRIVDITAWKVQKARLLLQVGRKEVAAAAYQDLIERNPDNNEYVRGYLSCNGLDLANSADHSAIIEVLEMLEEQFPRSNSLKFLPLTFCEGDNFARAADKMAKHALRKGIPSLFTSFKSLYNDAAKSKALEDLFEKYHGAISSSKRFDNSTADEPESALVWILFYLAQHFDYHTDYERALSYIEMAISKSPETVELFMVKAKILKHAGDTQSARDTMDVARQMDIKDRFVNSKTVKYMLRNSEVDEAEKTMVMFVREDAPHKIQEIVDMQAIWYMQERGDAYNRLGDLGRALKQYHQVQVSFDAYYNDQFDFHQYSLRKFTMRSYVDILAVGGHSVLTPGLHCLGPRRHQPIPASDENKRVTRNGTSKQGNHTLSAGVGEAKPAAVDKDPSGSEYVESADLLADGLKFVEALEKFAGDQPQTHLSAFEVHLRMNKYFLVLKAINALKTADPAHPALIPWPKSYGALSGLDTYMTENAASLPHVLAACHALLAMDANANKERVKAAMLSAAAPEFGSARTIESLLAAKALAIKAGAEPSDIDKFAVAAKQVYPMSSCF